MKDQFKINTFSVEEYCNRIAEEKLPTSLTLRFTLRQRMIYYLFWTAYSTKVAAGGFEKFFGVPLKKMYGAELKLAKLMGFVTEEWRIQYDAEGRILLSLLRKLLHPFLH